MSRFLIACGGTGGHLSPGIALAEGLIERGHRVTLLISQKQVDRRLSDKYPHLEFVPIAGAGFSWRPGGLLRFVGRQTVGFAASVRLMRTARPDAVVGFGGFTSAAFIAAGALLGVPVGLHEANRVPGRTVRLLGRFAKRVYLPPGVSLASARSGAVREIGLPVRREFRRVATEAARRELGLQPAARVVAVLGGSQGATPLNEWARRELPVLAAAGLQLYCVTGLGKGAEETLDLKSRDGRTVRAIFAPFTDRMAVVLAASDLVVSRAGAGTIAELIRTETPAILVPYPQAADNHQAANARHLKSEGAGWMVEQSRLSELGDRVLALLSDETRREQARQALQRLNQEDPLMSLVADLEDLAGRGRAEASLTKGTVLA